ncbi:MAG: CDP-glycerol glycerophosphotransferase family protein [Eubacterium sp.]|nr:CDP-glycerol glycerophosphotransferase family protein [Eubacterium sp.]
MTKEAQELLKPFLEEAQVKYLTNPIVKTRSDYYDAFLKYDLDDHLILYEAFFGRGITCNPGAIFNYLLHDERFKDFTHVWSLEKVEDIEALNREYADVDNVIFIETQSEEYFKYLASAKYLITNVTIKSYFIKKEGQILINTWHGIPLKNIGYDIPGSDIDMRNMFKNLVSSDYIISPVPYTTENFKTAFKLDGIFPGKVIEAGYPRIDDTVNFDKKALKKELDKFGVPYDETKKLILYAPTWKGEKYGTPDYTISEYEKFLSLLYSKIDTEKYQILFKPHQLVYKTMVGNGNVKKEYVPAGINTNLLLGGTDILISDYSSIFFDFLVTGRPILFYIPDVENYKKSRGLYMPVEDLPGPITLSAEQVADWVSKPDELDSIIDKEKYQAAAQKYTCNDDGHVCEKVANAVFFGDESNCVSLKTDKFKLLLHLDAILANGISFSLFNLMNNIDTDKYDVTFFSTGARAYSENYIKSIPKDIRVYYKPDGHTANVETIARINYSKENGLTAFDGDDMFPTQFYRDEYRRMFCDIHFDCIADFSGMNSYYANIYVANTDKNCKKVIWQHNVLRSEHDKIVNGVQVFKGHLDCIYKLYPYYDKYVACSKTTMLENRKDIAIDETYSRFSYAKNMINADRVVRGVEEKEYIEIDGEKYIYLNDDSEGELAVPAPKKENINFVTMGRLADAKNHINLIRAFNRFRKKNPDSRLYIIGDGPIANKTAKERDRFKLQDKVILTGNVNNPFAIMSDCDCFLLPSIFEGQPMVLLEARVIGLPIVVSDFDTVKDSMYENGQMLIGTGVDDIYEALVAFKDGKVPNEYKFDAEQYNREAMEEFEKAIN